MSRGNKLILTFESHYFAIKAKKQLSEGYRLSPTPRIISSSCSSCLMSEFPDCDIIDKERLIKLQGIEGVYITDLQKKEIIYEK